MILGIGTDIIEINRVQKAVERTSNFTERVFTQKEIQYFDSRNNRFEVIAGNFAAKEAVVKALGVGLRNFEWKDIEVLRDILGKPYVILYNNAKLLCGEDSIIHISISHCKEYATANAVLESLEKDKSNQKVYWSEREDYSG